MQSSKKCKKNCDLIKMMSPTKDHPFGTEWLKCPLFENKEIHYTCCYGRQAILGKKKPLEKIATKKTDTKEKNICRKPKKELLMPHRIELQNLRKSGLSFAELKEYVLKHYKINVCINVIWEIINF